MSTIVLLSSSPPQVFARSPTPAGSSSPLPSTASLIQDRSPGRNKFRTKVDQRDGFSAPFSTARQVLKEKTGAENILMMSPRRTRFRSSQEESLERLATTKTTEKTLQTGPHGVKDSRKPVPAGQGTKLTESKSTQIEKPLAAQDSNKDVIGERESEALLLERVAARKTDWTPPKPQTAKHDGERTIEYSAGYMNGMLSSFTYADPSSKVSGTKSVEASNPAKRRKVDRPSKATMYRAASAPTLSKANSVPTKAASAKSRSPTKKTLTITGLATSNYLGQDEMEDSPMMQYLTSTQAQLHDTSAEAGLETKIQKTKTALQKLKASKKNQPKSLLLSPQSAMKTYDDQDTIFGSASQLAREESPTFIKETIEAMKQSESFLMSDPVSPPQRTQPTSADNTPRVGTSRFRKTRNLWSAAGRDDDNALLHVDTIDLTDSPAVRAAFTGKDVMLQPGASRSESRSVKSLRGGISPLVSMHTATVIDIDNVTTPDTVSRRTFSTTATSTSPRKVQSRSRPEPEQDTKSQEPDTSLPRKQIPPKPSYAGFTIHELNKLIKSYGFKAMRKREKMIELLDRCWEEKHGTSTVEQAEPEAAPFGDFLSKVHDISARPEPKIKKARVRKKKDETGKDVNKDGAKKPRQRKKKEVDNNPEGGVTEKPEVKRTRKPKLATANDARIPDIDLILESIPEELRALEAFDEWAKPERKVKPGVQQQATKAEAMPEVSRPPTPPATLPLDHRLTTLPALQEKNDVPEIQDQPANPNPTPTPSATLKPSTIDIQITAAIMHQSKSSLPGRNHNIEPTWHEKILLYDPIVLEDMAAWLNTEGFAAIGEDREISALDVREWLETRGICCLWRGGWRGNKVAQQ